MADRSPPVQGRTLADNPLVRLVAEARLAGARSRHDEFLPETEFVSRRRHSPYATWLIYVLSALVLAVGCWMHFARIDDVVTVQGVVRTAGKPRTVSHADGGRIARVLVREGQQVVAGEPLVLLDDKEALQEIARLSALDRMLAIEILRLESELRESPAAPKFPPDLDAEVLASQLNLWRARRDEIASRRVAADLMVERARARAAALRGRVLATEAAETALARQYAEAQQAVAQGRVEALHADVLRRELADRRRDLQALRDDLQAADQSHAGAVEQRVIIDREWQSASRKRLAEATIERERAGAALQRQESLRRDLALRAPIDGVVSAVLFGEGSLVRPGDPVAGVLPAGQTGRIEIEARVAGSDAAAVTVGQDVFVRPESSVAIRHGTIKGTVIHVAREATTNPARLVVRIALDREIPAGSSDHNRLGPGTPAIVDLLVGEASVIEFLVGRARR